MKTIEAHAREAGFDGYVIVARDDYDDRDAFLYWQDALARFAAAVRREALGEAAPLLLEAMEALPDYVDGRNDDLCDRIDALLTSLQSPPSPEGTSDTGTR